MLERFDMHLGPGYDPEWPCGLSDEELAKEIRKLGEWDPDLLRDLCWRAGIIEEWEEAGDDFEEVAFKAAEKLGVEIL